MFVKWTLNIMKMIITITTLLLSIVGVEAGVETNLSQAILKLPPRYLADVPIENRRALLESLSSDPKDGRLDYKNGWIHFYSDGGDHESPKGRPTSMFWVKLLPRQDQSPLVFVHMSKPFADGSIPGENQTFVLEKSGKGWEDITKKVIPRKVDMTAHFRPRRKMIEIEVAPYEKIPVKDGGKTAYGFGEHKFDLVWNGSALVVRKASSPKLSGDD